MRLLVVTQKVDRNDPILGFFHGWIAEFSKRFNAVVVICLERRSFDLPKNVTVLSLGKEKYKDRLKYIFLFYYLSIFNLRHYDAVFVHMNHEYVVLMGWLWRIMGKKVYMWRNHHDGSFLTDIAAIFCNKVFCTSKYSYTAKYKKTTLMPVGINTNLFKPDPSLEKVSNSILFLGRIAPAKNVNIFIDALGILKDKKIIFSADIYGDALPRNAYYLEKLKSRVSELGLEDRVLFKPGVPNQEAPAIYNTHEVFVNLSSSGMYDKTIFEAMACGCLAIASNENLRGQIDDRLVVSKREAEEVAHKLVGLLSLSESEKQKMILDNIKFADTQSLSNLSWRLNELI